MIEGCIVAKLVLGYLTDEGLHRTCVAFQEECSLFHNGNSNLDQVLLTSDLKTILEDYSQLKETGRENGIPTSTAVLKSLWRDLDVVIGQLKYATIPSNEPKVNTMRNQSTRTRRLNYDRSRRSTMQKNHERVTTSSSTYQRPSTPSLLESNATEKVPLRRLSAASTSQLSSANKGHTANSLLSCAGTRTVSGVRSAVNKDINIYQASMQSVGDPVAGNVAQVTDTASAGVPVAESEDQVRGAPRRCAPVTASSFGNSPTNNEQCSNGDAVGRMFDVMDDGDFSGADHHGNETTPVIVISDESSKDEQVVAAEEHSLSHSNTSQNELQLRSPKRKGVQPKKRVPQGDPSTPAVTDSPIKQVSKPTNQEFEMDIVSASDSLTPQSFLGTLLNTPLLQEKLAENINKVVGSSRAQPANKDEPPSDSTQSMTTTEASSEDALMVSNQEAGGNIPVKEIMDLMQADPAFDVLFSFFGLDALDALPPAANSSPVLAGTSTDSHQADKSTSASVVHIPDTLGALPSLPTESAPPLGNEITLPSGPSQQQDTPSSSSASDLHLSAASIVTDALLLLAGSPQKVSSQTSQMNYSASVQMPEVQNPVTPPKNSHAVQRISANEKPPGQQCGQPALITSTLPYVRALNFALGQEKVPGKRGRKKGSKNNKGTKQKTTINEQGKAPSNKKGASTSRRCATTKKPPGLTSVSSSSDTGFGFRSVQAMPCLNNTNGQQLVSCGSTFNRIILPNPSPGNLMMQSSNPNPSPYTLVNCTSDPIFLPGNVIGSCPSAANVTSCSAANTPSVVTYIAPATGLHTGVIPTPGSHAGAVVCQSPVPVNQFTSSSLHVSSPLVLDSVSSVPNPSTISLTTFYPPLQPSTVNVANTGTGHVPSEVNITNTGKGHVPSVVNITNTGTNRVPLPSGFMNLNIPSVSSAASSLQPINTVTSQAVIPGHLTESAVISAAAGIRNPITCQADCNTDVSSGLAPSETAGAIEPFSLEASSLLQTLAQKQANAQTNSTGHYNPVSGSDTGQINVHSLQTNVPHPTVEAEVGHQPLQEISASQGNANVSKNSAEVSREENVGAGISLVQDSPLEQDLKRAVPVETNVQNPFEKVNNATASLSILNQECSEMLTENTIMMLHSKQNGESERQGSSGSQRKRQRDEFQQQKGKKSKSSSRPPKRSRTKGESINFPTNLNVEEFLSTLHYEDK